MKKTKTRGEKAARATRRTPRRAPAGSAAMFVRVADCGVGATGGRYHAREMLNCVRFGKLRAPDADPAAPPRAVLLCASQDGRCYVYALDVKSDAGGGGFERSDGSPTNAVSRSVESDGGQGGRGPRRRARVDARLALVTTIELPCACAAASSPTAPSPRASATSRASFCAGTESTGTTSRRTKRGYKTRKPIR